MNMQPYTKEELAFAEELHRKSPLSLYEILLDQAARITELEAQLADAQKDVERYQWLRQYEGDNETFNKEMDNANCPTEFDCAIDAAIAKEAT